MEVNRVTLDGFREAVRKKLHETGYCEGMSEERINEGMAENEDIIGSLYEEIQDRGEAWCIRNAAWNVSLCI